MITRRTSNWFAKKKKVSCGTATKHWGPPSAQRGKKEKEKAKESVVTLPNLPLKRFMATKEFPQVRKENPKKKVARGRQATGERGGRNDSKQRKKGSEIESPTQKGGRTTKKESAYSPVEMPTSRTGKGT